MKEPAPKKNCRGCRYWYPLPAHSGESDQVGWCHRPITYYANGKDYARGIFPETSAGFHCGEWKPKDAGEA